MIGVCAVDVRLVSLPDLSCEVPGREQHGEIIFRLAVARQSVGPYFPAF